MGVVINEREEMQRESGSQSGQKRITGFFAMVAFTVILLAILELLSFVAMRVLRASVFEETPGARMLAAYKGQSWAGALAREEKESRKVYDYKPYTIWRSHPYQGQAVNIDENGMRKTYFSHCDANEYTIWMFGGSTMRGNGSPDWGTIPSQLAELYEKNGQPACVRNFGEGAWVSTQEVTQLMLALKSENRKPNLVIFYDGANDTFVPYQSGKANVHMNFDTIKNQFESQRDLREGSFGYLFRTNLVQLLFSLVMRSHEHAGDRPIPASDLDGLAQATVRNYFSNLEIVNGLAREYSFDYAFFWQPNLFASHKELLGPEKDIQHSPKQAHLEQWVPRVYELIRGQKRDHFYDISNVLDGIHEQCYLDWCHIVMSANRVVAQRMFDVLHRSSS